MSLFSKSRVLKKQINTQLLNKYIENNVNRHIDLYHLNFIILNKVLCENQNFNTDGYFSYLQPNNLTKKIAHEYKRRLWLGGTIETFQPEKLLNKNQKINNVILKEILDNVKLLKKDCMVTYTRTICEENNSEEGNILLKEKRQLFYTNELFHERIGNTVDFTSFIYNHISDNLVFSDEEIIKFSRKTLNPHYIHLDKYYNKKIEGYPEKLVVQGPYMLIESIKYLQHITRMKYFSKITYKIKQNLFSNEPVFIKLSTNKKELKLGNNNLGTVLTLNYI